MIDVLVIGGGILGLATAYELDRRRPGRAVVILEKEKELARHQTGHNSGVIHSGIYYRPGSLKAENCRRGIEKLLSFCDAQGVPYELCGKVIVATTQDEIRRLEVLLERGIANGVEGLELIGTERLREIEPHARGVAALHSPRTGIVDFRAVALRCGDVLAEHGQKVETGAEVTSLQRRSDAVVVETTRGDFSAVRVVNCTGLFSDRVARMSGFSAPLRIVPFRGEYLELEHDRRYLVRNLIYPVPDPRFPFLGAHFTRTMSGAVEAGPNAVLALAREGYHWSKVEPSDLWEMVRFSGFWKMVARYLPTGLGELYRSLDKKAFVRALKRLVPDVEPEDLVPTRTGVRAQALDGNGKLVDDFVIRREERVVNVLNAPSPGATSAFAMAERIVDFLDESS